MGLGRGKEPRQDLCALLFANEITLLISFLPNCPPPPPKDWIKVFSRTNME
jgi:hypothetical protein